jgi:hypothetical protein
MSYCPECGAEVSTSASFCESCGEELEPTESKSTSEQSESKPETATATGPDGFDWRHAGAATGFGLIPAFGAYMLVSMAAYEAIVPVFLFGIPVFGFLLYRRASKKAMASGMFFWIAVESFLTPLAAIFYTSSYSAKEAESAAEQAGAAIGGGIVTVFAFILGLSIGIVFYLLSRRLEPEGA